MISDRNLASDELERDSINCKTNFEALVEYKLGTYFQTRDDVSSSTKGVYLNLTYSTWRVLSSHETPLQALTIVITERRLPNESTSIVDQEDSFYCPSPKK